MTANAPDRIDESPNTDVVSIDEIGDLLAEAIEPKRGDRKRTARGGLQSLNALDTDSWPLAARWIHGWYLHLLKDRKVKLSSVKRYGGEVIDDVLVGGFDIDFRVFDATDFEDFYQRALDNSHKRKNIGYKADRFDDLHAFGVTQYDFARLPEPLNDQSNASHVSAVVIPEHVFVEGRDSVLKRTDIDVSGRNCLWVLLTVLHRAGLRRSDALSLRLADLDPGDTFWLRVADNGYADTKRGKHRVPLTPLLLPEERNRVHAFLYHRLQSGDSKKALVFHPTGTPLQPWCQSVFSKLYATVVRCGATGTVHTPHDSRHTCISQLQLVIENCDEWVARLTPYSSEQANEIRAAILHDSPVAQHNYWSLASMVAHSSPQSTFTNYLHYTNLAVYDGIREIASSISLGQLKNLAGTTARRAARWFTSAGIDNDLATIDSLDAALSVELHPFVVANRAAINKLEAPEPVPTLYQPFTRSTKDLDVAHRALTRYYEKTPIEVLTRTLGVSRETISAWIDNCEFIASMRTRKHGAGTRRHVAVSRALDGDVPCLPPLPRHRLEKKRLPKILAAIQSKLESNPEDLKHVCSVWLTRSTVSNSGLPIDDVDTLRCLLDVFANALPAKQWRLQLSAPKGSSYESVVDDWCTLAGLEVSKHSAPANQSAISARLYLRHPDEENMTTMTKIAIQREGEEPRLPNKFSSMLFRYVFFMSTVVLFSPDDVRAMAEI